jgi:hypothetical protein
MASSAALEPVELDLEATDGDARAGRVRTPRGVYDTPCFMPVGTRGAVRTLSSAGCPGDPVCTGCPEFWVLRAHGLVPCTRDPVRTGSQPPCARGVQNQPVGAPTASFCVWLFKGSVPPPVWGLFIHLLNTILSLSPPLPNPYLPSM